MAKAYSTINTTLEFGTAADATSKICKIKSYPDLGGTPDMIDVTDLEDTYQSYIPGVISMPDAMEFTCNFTPDAYAAAVSNANTDGYYKLNFGSPLDDGYACFSWEGRHTVYVTGGDVNAAREFVIAVAPSSEITVAYS